MDNLIEAAKSKVRKFLATQPGRVVSQFGSDLNRTLQNIGTGTGAALQTFVSQPLAGIKERNIMKSQNLASQAMQEKIRQQQGLSSQQNIPYLLNQSRAYSNTPDFTASNLKFAESNLQKRIDTGTQQTGIKSFMQNAAPATNVLLTGLGGKAIGAMPAIQKATTLGTSALLSGGVGALTGENPFESALAGVLQTPRIVGLTGPSSFLTKYGASGIMDKLATPLSRNIAGRAITGLGNVIEDEFLSKLNNVQPQLGDRVLSFGIGALLAPTKEYEAFIQSGDRNLVKKIKEAVRDLRGRYATEAGIKPKSLDYMVEDPNTRQMVLRSKLDEKIPGVMSDLEKLNKYLEQKTNGFGNVAKSIRDEQGNVLPEYKGLTPEVTNTPSSQQSTISQLSPSPVVLKQQVSPLDSIISENPNAYLAEPKEGKVRLDKLKQEKYRANQDYKEWQKEVLRGTVTPEQRLKNQLNTISGTVRENTNVGGVDPTELKDISGFKSYTRDVYRNFQEVYGDKFKDIKRTLLDPFDRAKGNLSRSYEKWATRLNKEVEIDLGIKKGSKESAAVQNFGEGNLSASQLVEQFGRKKAENIVNADKWFRAEYDKLLTEVNGVMARIYPNNPDKIITRRSDYYRHFKEMGNSISGLLNIFDSPSNISSSLSGTSEWVRPKSKWLSLAQKRLGNKTDEDAVGGFLDYIKAAEYNKNIDPFTNQFRKLAEDLAIQTEKDPKINNFIEYLHDFSNDLAGKTNPADRFVQKIIPGGRKTMSAINWINNRVKANTIVGNLSSTVAQIFNVPQGIAEAGLGNSTKGLGLSISNIFGEATPIKKSDFITERYGGGAFDRFDRSMVDNVKKGAVWITGVLDEVGTKYIWNSQYAKALSENIPNPIKYADDVTRKLVAGRGIGEVPLIQKSKIFQLVAPFQLEVGNLWHVMGDWVGEKKFGKLATFFIASHLFNKAAEQIRGSDVSIDPIQASIDAYNTYSEEEDKGLGLLKAGGRLGGEILSNIPGAQNAAAAYPEFGFKVGDKQMPTREDFFGEGDPTRFGSGLLLTKGLQDPLYKIIPPFGGNQLKRTIEGQQATNRGYSESATGRVRFPTENTPLRNIQRAVFGQYSTPNAREYFKNDTSVLGEKQTETFKSLSPDKAQEYYKQIVSSRSLEKEREKIKLKVRNEGVNEEVNRGVNKIGNLSITTSEKNRGMPFPDFSKSAPGQILRADLDFSGSGEAEIVFNFKSSDGKTYSVPQTNEKYTGGNEYYGLELEIPKETKPGTGEVWATVNGKEILGTRKKHEVINTVATDRYSRTFDDPNDMTLQRPGIDNTPTQENIKYDNDLGGEVIYQDTNGEVKALKYGKVLSLPETNSFEKAIKTKKAYAVVDDIVDADIPEDQKTQIYSQLGIKPQEAKYYRVAKEDNDIKTAYIMDKLGTLKPNDRKSMFEILVKGRLEVNKSKIVSDGVLDNLYEQDLLSKEEVKKLKTLRIDNTGKKPVVKLTGRGKTAKLKKLKYTPLKLKLKPLKKIKDFDVKSLKL